MKTANAAVHRSSSLIQEISNRTLVAVTLFYLAGIVICRFWISSSPAALPLAAAIAVLVAATVYFRVHTLYKAALILVAAAAGGGAFYFALQQPAHGLLQYIGAPLYLEGTVIEEPLFYDDHTAYLLQAEMIETAGSRLPVTGRLLVRVYGEGGSYWFGERLRLRGSITEPRGLRNPGGFDYRYYLRSQGIDAVIYPGSNQVISLGRGTTGPLTGSAVKLRSAMVQNIEATLPSPSAELLTAILFGQRHRLPGDVEENFRRAGAGHLMAVSGLHVGLVSALILGLWSRLNLRGRLPLLIAIVLVFAYAYLTGLRPSALRAAIMVSMAMGALLLDREHDLPTAVSFAALVTLFINPLLLFTIGFQLSYTVTLVLVYAYRPLHQMFAALRCPGFLRAPLAVTAAAQVGVLPLCIYYFQHVPAGALLFNLLLLPLIAFVVGLGLAGALAGLVIPLAGEILLWAARVPLELMLFITGFSSAEYFYIPFNPPGTFYLVAYYALLSGVLIFYYRWNKYREKGSGNEISLAGYLKYRLQLLLSTGHFRPLKAGIIVLGLAVALLWSGILFPRQVPLTVTFVDVGQGHAALIEPPCGIVIMVDAGGTPAFQGWPGEVGERTVLPLLRYKGIKRVDLAVITHPHEDHFGGFIPLVGQVALHRILVSPVAGGSGYYAELLESAEKTGSVIMETGAGQAWNCGEGMLLEILGPPERLLTGTKSDLNNNSIVFILHYGDIRMLFPGDIEDEGVRDLLARNPDLSADVLLVPHHGGYLEAMPVFLDAVKPSLAVIQVGPNPFGHPHPYVINALNQADVPVYRNDLHGAVIIETDGSAIKIIVTEQPAAVNQ